MVLIVDLTSSGHMTGVTRVRVGGHGVNLVVGTRGRVLQIVMLGVRVDLGVNCQVGLLGSSLRRYRRRSM